MHLRLILFVTVLFAAHLGYGQTSVETSATTHDVKINDKKIKGVGGEARVRERKGKALPKERKLDKRHKSHSEAGVFKRHNHFAKKSGSARKRGSRKAAPKD